MRVAIVEEWDALRQRLAEQLEAMPGVCVVGEAIAESPAIAMLRELRPDLVLLGGWLADGHGFNVLRTLRDEGMACRVLALADGPGANGRRACRRLGADGPYDKTDVAALLARVRAEAVRADLPSYLPTFPR